MEWISVKEHLPRKHFPEQERDWMLVYSESEEVCGLARYNGKKWQSIENDENIVIGAYHGDIIYHFHIDKLTHWMPLPPPPPKDA